MLPSILKRAQTHGCPLAQVGVLSWQEWLLQLWTFHKGRLTALERETVICYLLLVSPILYAATHRGFIIFAVLVFYSPPCLPTSCILLCVSPIGSGCLATILQCSVLSLLCCSSPCYVFLSGVCYCCALYLLAIFCVPFHANTLVTFLLLSAAFYAAFSDKQRIRCSRYRMDHLHDYLFALCNTQIF